MRLIRLAIEKDAPALAAIYGPYCEQTAVSFETVAPSPGEMARRIAKITEQFPWLVLETPAGIVGYAYASSHRERLAYRWSVDVSAYVEASSRRQGVGRALYSALFRVLEAQGYFKAFAGVALPNLASVGLHEAMGFEPVGVYRKVGYKLGRWHDVAWYQRVLQPERTDPEPPRPVSALIGRPGWAEAVAAGLT